MFFRALTGGEGEGLTWKPYGPSATIGAYQSDFREAEPAPDNPAPRYPARAELGCAAGEVVTQFTIDADGRVPRESLLIVRSTHPLFSIAVRDALPSMRFRPATRFGSADQDRRIPNLRVQAVNWRPCDTSVSFDPCHSGCPDFLQCMLERYAQVRHPRTG